VPKTAALFPIFAGRFDRKTTGDRARNRKALSQRRLSNSLLDYFRAAIEAEQTNRMDRYLIFRSNVSCAADMVAIIASCRVNILDRIIRFNAR
jgi:hypothetical protein